MCRDMQLHDITLMYRMYFMQKAPTICTYILLKIRIFEGFLNISERSCEDPY